MILFDYDKLRFTVEHYLVEEEDTPIKGAVITLRTDQGDTAVIRIPATYCGRIIPVFFQSVQIATLCLLKTDDLEEVKNLSAKTTLFFNQQGQAYSHSTAFRFLDNPADRITAMNPRDVVRKVILPSELNQTGKYFSYDNTTLRLTSFLPVQIQALAVCMPVKGINNLYTIVSEGLDALNYTDLDWGAVIEVTYHKEETLVTEYVRVGSPEHLLEE